MNALNDALRDRSRTTPAARSDERAVAAPVAKEWRAARNAGDCSSRTVQSDGLAPTTDPAPRGGPTRGEAVALGCGGPRTARLCIAQVKQPSPRHHETSEAVGRTNSGAAGPADGRSGRARDPARRSMSRPSAARRLRTLRTRCPPWQSPVRRAAGPKATVVGTQPTLGGR
jgi:hypothetical protein